MARVALIADVGEGFGRYTMGDDAALLDIVSGANIACGFHAGDPRIMEATVATCAANGVGIGAHPGFPDLVGFGRRSMQLSADEVRTDVLYQLGALFGFARARGVELDHVTVHGRLDNMAVTDSTYAGAIIDAISSFDPSLLVAVEAGELERASLAAGQPVAYTFMADRAYESNGQAVSRDKPGALLHDTVEIVARTVRAVTTGVITSIDGDDIPMPCQAVLVHGDSPEAVENARSLRAGLEAAGVEIVPVGRAVSGR